MTLLEKRQNRKFRANARSLAIILQIIIGCSALVAGYDFIANPSGKLLGLSGDVLLFSPFRNYLIPGVLLFFFNGLLNIVCALFLIKKYRQGPTFLIFQGIVLCMWIIVEILMLRQLNIIQMFCFCIGLFFIFAGNWIRFR